MANPSWPSSLPVPLVNGASIVPAENRISTQMDAGRAKLRRRFTSMADAVSYTVLVNLAQKQTLKDFEAITCSGVMPFDWEDFSAPDGTPATYRFLKSPSFTPYRGGSLWLAALTLEMIATSPGHYLLSDGNGSVIVDAETNGLTT